jgi:DNA polymerase-3 subunit alpha
MDFLRNFIHLHCHSSYSLLSGAAGIAEILARAKQLRMDAVALTDTNGLYGIMPF